MNDQLKPEDVLFHDVVPEEREACLLYELARESQTLRHIFQNHWHQKRASQLPIDAPTFLRPAPDSDENVILQWITFQENWMPLLEWSERDAWLDQQRKRACEERRQRIDPLWEHLTAKERRTFAQVNRTTGADCSVTELPSSDPYFIHTPYQLLPDSRCEKLPFSLWPSIKRVPATILSGRKSDLPTAPQGSEFLCLFVRWKGNTDRELVAEFEKRVHHMRPDEFKGDAKRKKPWGKKTPEAEATRWLRALGACRLLARFKNAASVPNAFKSVWFKNPGLMRENSRSINDIFHKYFPFLPEDEKPLCLINCEKNSRFDVRGGRPRKT